MKQADDDECKEKQNAYNAHMKGFDYSKLKGLHYRAYTRVLYVIDMRTCMVIEFSHNQILFNLYLDGHKKKYDMA